MKNELELLKALEAKRNTLLTIEHYHDGSGLVIDKSITGSGHKPLFMFLDSQDLVEKLQNDLH